MTSVKNKAKEHKERRKKKDKVVVITDNLETRSEIVKGSLDKGKSHEEVTLAESETASLNPEGREKKNKRKLHGDWEDEEHSPNHKARKKRREKSSVAIPDPPFVAPVALTLEVTGTKKRRRNKETPDHSSPATVTTPDPGASDPCAESSSQSPPKSKKRKKEVTLDDSTSLRSKQCIHLNPSNDPDLSEQSQKALLYAYSQFVSPGTWKFNKARQNWIVRNFWTSKIPEKYVPTVVEYLSRVQGRRREILVESCETIISGTDPESATQVGTGGENLPGNTDALMSITTKRKRAETLLSMLGKS